MMKGYHGKVLFVDLTSGSITEKSLAEKVYRDFIGGQGLGMSILYEHMKPKVDPLGPDNMLGFLVGPLTGTGIHMMVFSFTAYLQIQSICFSMMAKLSLKTHPIFGARTRLRRKTALEMNSGMRK